MIEPVRHSDFAPKFAAVLANVMSCDDGCDLPVFLREAVSLLGFENGVFMTFTRDDEGLDSYRFVLACRPEWCHQYNTRRWFAIDPCLIYATNNIEPAILEDVPIRSAGQRELMHAAAQVGFASGVVVPTHTATGRSRMGVLYLGNESPGSVSRASVASAKMYMRGLATELLEWWCRKLRSELLERSRLKDADRDLLKLVHQGHRTDEIAQMLGTTRGALDQRLSRLAARFGVNGKKKAAELAYEQGLLGHSQWG